MPPYGQQPYQPSYADGIALTLKWFPLNFIFAFLKPVVTINGQRVEVPWSRRTVIPLQPGHYHLHVHVPYLLPSEVGKSDVTVPVGGGQPVELEYRAPAWAFSPGALGPPPQQHQGMLYMWLLMALPLALLLLIVICCCGGSIWSSIVGTSTT